MSDGATTISWVTVFVSIGSSIVGGAIALIGVILTNRSNHQREERHSRLGHIARLNTTLIDIHARLNEMLAVQRDNGKHPTMSDERNTVTNNLLVLRTETNLYLGLYKNTEKHWRRVHNLLNVAGMINGDFPQLGPTTFVGGNQEALGKAYSDYAHSYNKLTLIFERMGQQLMGATKREMKKNETGRQEAINEDLERTPSTIMTKNLR